jgi:hypothetical protein
MCQHKVLRKIGGKYVCSWCRVSCYVEILKNEVSP